MGDRDSDELLGLSRQRAVLEDGLAEPAERRVDLWREAVALIGQRLGRFGIQGVAHRPLSISVAWAATISAPGRAFAAEALIPAEHDALAAETGRAHV